MSRLTLIILAAAGITLFSGVSFWLYAAGQVAIEQATTSEHSSADAPTLLTYSDPVYGFSFEYPAEFTVGSFEDLDTDGNSWHVVLVQSPDATSGFQVSVREFDEEGPLTRERLAADLGAVLLDDAQDITVGQGTLGVMLPPDSEHGPEAWFIHNTNLYQVTGHTNEFDLLQGVLLSWRFIPLSQ